MHGNSDAERIVTGHQAKYGRVDLVHVQRNAVQRAVVGLCFRRLKWHRGIGEGKGGGREKNERIMVHKRKTKADTVHTWIQESKQAHFVGNNRA